MVFKKKEVKPGFVLSNQGTMAINVMIVDDSIIIRALLKEIIENDPQKRFKVIASAANGEDALVKLNSFPIDVITMDVEMPKKNGLETVKEIMMINPKPIIMLSSLTKKGAKETIEALSFGAIDFITKPENKMDFIQLKTEVCEKLALAFRTKQHKPVFEASAVPSKPVIKTPLNEPLSNLLLIGCSTGGPKALHKIVSQIPADFPAAIVIVQHMPDGGYTASLAEHLNRVSTFAIKEAEDGDELKNGTIYIAPGGHHTEIYNRSGKLRVVLNKREAVSGHRPSVDAMFASVARLKPQIPVYGIVLTGMGSDGTKGAHALKTMGAKIIAESEETAVIFGMPKQVINQNLADQVLKLQDIVPSLCKQLR